jgi:hypothetical protein
MERERHRHCTVIRHYSLIKTLDSNCIDHHCRRYRYDSSLVEVGIDSGSAHANMDIVGTVDEGAVEVGFGYDVVVGRGHLCVG